jgi:transposase
MPPAYVKPYVKRQKNDAADAEAICEAVTRANVRLVKCEALGWWSDCALDQAARCFCGC